MFEDSNFIIAFNEKAKMVHTNAVNKGFWESGRSVAECIALIHSELSEALEGDRKATQDTHLPVFNALEMELADAVIRIMDLAAHKNLMVAEAIVAKHAYNLTRPHKHGKKY